MNIRVKMFPHLDGLKNGESGIHTVIRHYFDLLPEFGVTLVGAKDTSYDIAHTHAGTRIDDNALPVICSLHGLYWTGEYDAPLWEKRMNASLVHSIRAAKAVTVPSNWVNETLMRDMHMTATVLPHGINWDDWQHNHDNEGYVIAYAKNRAWADVSIPTISSKLAGMFPETRFVATFATSKRDNLHVTGAVPHDQMKRMVQGAAVFVSPVKETFGIAALEAMAAGVPVLTVDTGQVPELVGHGVGGYCYQPGSEEDMADGLRYCLDNRAVLGANAREMARAWTWEAAVEQLYNLYTNVAAGGDKSVGVVIPVYNKEVYYVERAINSVLLQSREPAKIVVVDDGSDDGEKYRALCQEKGVEYIRQENKGVAHARNAGIAALDTEYICCLDADDYVESRFLETCANELDINSKVYISYTGITTMSGGKESLSKWPAGYDFDKFLKRHNQVPTCCVFRRVVWERLGGYRQRYAPTGAGAEDAEFFLRAGALGYGAKKVTDRGMFHYTLGEGHTSQEGYQEIDWLSWHKPWVEGDHPLASYATPVDNVSHPIYSYDKPMVSIVVAVGTGHEELLIDCLDSIEGQTVREWEVVVVWDSDSLISKELKDAYPFVFWASTRSPGSGPGVARNIGVDSARGAFVVFLDADDWLYPDFLKRTLAEWNATPDGSVIYTDYAGVIDVPEGHELVPRDAKRFINRIGNKNFLAYESSDYDCERAIIQPVGDKPYLWCSVTALVPRSWHYDIGGFDEKLETWEDVDYWWRMARAGKCFVRIPERLFAYRLDGGKRREQGLQQRPQLLESLRKKYRNLKGDAMCGCRGTTSPPAYSGVARGHGGISTMAMSNVSDNDIVMVQYNGTNMGQHPIRGQVTKDFYGYRSGGERFLMALADVKAQPHLYRVLEEAPQGASAAVAEKRSKPEPPKVLAKASDMKTEEEEEEEVVHVPSSPDTPISFDTLGVQKRAADALRDAGISTIGDVMRLGAGREDIIGKLVNIKYVGETTAEALYDLVMSI